MNLERKIDLERYSEKEIRFQFKLETVKETFGNPPADNILLFEL